MRLMASNTLDPDDQNGAWYEAQLLLAHVLDCQRSLLLAHPEMEPTEQQRHAFGQLIKSRSQGHPIAYLTGHKEFYGLNLEVDENVLIPRPETELIVEAAIQRLPKNGHIADLGTGSGAIALAIATQRRNAHVYATDISPEALALATRNEQRHGLGNVRLFSGDWLNALPESTPLLDVIVSNPPYVEANDIHLNQGDCRFEPPIALTPGNDGLSAIRSIIDQAPQYLKPGGWLLLEHGYNQATGVIELFTQPLWSNTQILKDLAGHPRVSLAQFNSSSM